MTATTKKMVKGSTKLEEADKADPHKFFNLQKVIATTRIQEDKIYNNFKGAYNSLTDEEKKRIATCLMGPVKEIFSKLGMEVSFTKMSLNGSK